MKRFLALDGLRSVAILMVLLTHIPMKGWAAGLPIFGNGNLGIGILFLLTGFLMSYLHPEPGSAREFLGKRLSRLLPPFLTMAASLTIIRATGNNLPVLIQLGIVIGVALITRLIGKIYFWKYFVYGWLLIQAGTAMGYVFVLTKTDPAIFFQVWEPAKRWLVTGLVNATLTLPMGEYIMQLDGVYWSLVLEMLFYYLYPILLAPIFQETKKNKSKWFKGLLLVSVWPFCFGLTILASRILGFKMLNIWFFGYFIAGMSLGNNLDWWQKQINKLPKIILKPAGLIPGLAIIIMGLRWLEPKLPEFYYPWAQLIWVIPIGGLLLIATLGQKSWGKWLEIKPLIWLSRYGYSLYLAHAIVIEWVGKIMTVTTVLESWAFFLVCGAGAIGLAMILYFLTERQYFLRQKAEEEKPVKHYSGQAAGLIIFAFLGLYWAFSPRLAMFTVSFRHKEKGVNQEASRKITTEPIEFQFIAKDNNLGMITTHLRAIANKEIKTENQESSKLLIKLLDENKQLIAEASNKVSEIYEDNFHPFGFPIQSQSKGKKYTLEYQLVQSDLSREVETVNNEEDFISVYFLDKKQLMKNPGELASWLKGKILMPLMTPMYWVGLMYLGPTLALILLQSGIIKHSRG